MSLEEEAQALSTRSELDLLRKRVAGLEAACVALQDSFRRLIDHVSASELEHHELSVKLARHLDEHLRICGERDPGGGALPRGSIGP